MAKEKLKTIFESLFKSEDDPNRTLSGAFDLNNCEPVMSAEEEIKKVFGDHGKMGCFVSLENSGVPLTRTFHSLSVYLIGLYLLNKKFGVAGNKAENTFLNFNVEKLGIDISDFKFESLNFSDSVHVPDGINYIWTLTSLYHDVITNREKAELAKLINTADNPFITPVSFFNFVDFFKDKLRYTIFEDYPEIERILSECKKENKPSNNVVEPTYSEKTVNAYFRKRLHEGYIDHGIASGFVFYDSLVKNYLDKERKANGKEDDGSFSSEIFVDTASGKQPCQLTYRPEHLVFFKYIADAITVHNIWRYDKNDEQSKADYARFGLLSDEMKAYTNLLTIEDNPLAFFLCLVDTIEPTKYFDKISVVKLLEGISLNVNNNSIVIEFSEDLRKEIDETHQKDNTSRTLDAWFKDKPDTMTKWMSVTVERDKTNNGRFTIKLPKINSGNDGKTLNNE